ncbi:hypothetical protein RUM44_012991 [Polyplax serrata]
MIRLGGLFHIRDDLQELAFINAVEHSSRGVLSRRLVGQTRKVPEHNSFQVSQTVCDLMGTGVAGIFGPSSPESAIHVQSICDAKEIPHVEIKWNPYQKNKLRSLNIYPHPSSLSQALVDIVKAWKWKTFTIVYQSELELLQFDKVLKLSDSKEYMISVKQLGDGENYRDTLREVKNSGSNNIILDCPIDVLPEVLKQAQQVGLMVAEYSFIITNLDLHTIDLEFLQYGGTNITGFSMIDPHNPLVIETVKAWTGREAKNDRVLQVTPSTVRLDAALMNDAVWLFAKAARELHYAQNITMQPQDCNSRETWVFGSSINNYMKHTEIKGLTGLVKIHKEEGLRLDFTLHLSELTKDGLMKIGSWNTTQGLNLTRPHLTFTHVADEESLVNKTFVVIIAMSPPYSMLKEDSRQLSGNNRFEGFGVDLIQELSMMLGFNYTFIVQHDNDNGSLNKKTKKWSGMMKEIMEGRADLAITDLTITHDREGAVDFTMPFMTLGITILYKKPTAQPPSLFSFLSPFSNEVWVYMVAAYVGVSVTLFVMARISPYEWNNPYPCIEDPEELENQFSLKNSLWFTIGSLMQQGSDVAPIAVSTRMVAGIWWFFTLIMVSSYTANLAAFLTIESTSSPFRNVEDLANQKVIQYGAKKGGSTASFFQDSNYATYKKMWKYMQSNPDVFTSSNYEGLQRVLNENYAYLMESTSIEYLAERNCDITQIGGLLDSKGYGIAMRKNSTYRNALSTAVLQLQETGRLAQMKRKWWKEKRGGGACEDDEGGGEASELDLDNVGGVFVVLVCGVVMACVVTVCEVVWNISMIAKKEKVSFTSELVQEIKFAVKCHGSKKPVRKRESTADEVSEQLSTDNGNFDWFEGEAKKSSLH